MNFSGTQNPGLAASADVVHWHDYGSGGTVARPCGWPQAPGMAMLRELTYKPSKPMITKLC